ncbi:MAG: LLM class F420-dependent oxidoreductase [Armatimonadota bacterium]|nr:LLM class F420-dependent oxidoreductase [Armatimonadota bacterium]MDR7612122.1 LLM class F420-dependent oxidoreductase [Armatimonadota bacterium]
MEVGVVLPTAGPKATPENVTTVARWAHELGFGSVWATDHVILPERVESWYPYRSHGRWDYPPDTPWMDPLLALLHAGAVAPGLRLGTSILVAPLRHPVLLAKQVATLDVLSDGRVILGVGAGWLREEFELVGASFADRRRRVVEMVELMRTLWTGQTVHWEGRYYRVCGARMSPRPVQDRIPVVWGGHSEAALRRAARSGDGWHPTQIPLGDLRDGVRRLRDLWQKAGRDPEGLLVVARPGTTYPITPQTHAEHLEIGVTHLVADTPLRDPGMAALREEMERVAEVCGLRRR